MTGTITLSAGLLVDDSITISGPGANVLAVNGNAATRVFLIGSGKTVGISGLTVTNGKAVSVNGGGLLVPTGSTVTIANSIFSNNWWPRQPAGRSSTRGR